jgi:hypothetical protein
VRRDALHGLVEGAEHDHLLALRHHALDELDRGGDLRPRDRDARLRELGEQARPLLERGVGWRARARVSPDAGPSLPRTGRPAVPLWRSRRLPWRAGVPARGRRR